MKFLILFALMSSAFAEGPDKVGNGEVVVKCGDKVRLAEFHEAETLEGMKAKIKMVNGPEDVDMQILNAFNKLEDAKANFELYKKIKNEVNWVGDSYHWNFTNDLGPFPMVDGCEVENVINYYEDDFIEGNKKLYDALTNSEKAALWVHEVLYKRARRANRNLKSSLGIRRIVTLLFSDSKDADLLAGLEIKHLKAPKYNSVIVDNKGVNLSVEVQLPMSKPILEKIGPSTLVKEMNGRFDVSKVAAGKTYWFYVKWTNNYHSDEVGYLRVNNKYIRSNTVAPYSVAGVFFFILPSSVREFEKGRM